MTTEKQSKTVKKRKSPAKASKKDNEPSNGSAKKKRTARTRKIATQTVEQNPLTPKDLEYFYDRLLERRKELLGDVGYMKAEALHQNREESSGSLSNMPIHMADVGTDNYEQEFTLGLIESERKMLREIDLALKKIQDGTYGICEGTDQPIGRPRLEAKPEARFCIEYARKIEKGLVRPESVETLLEKKEMIEE